MLKKTSLKYAIKVLYADRAYDRQKLYKLSNKYGIKPKIPPKTDAVEHPKLDYMSDRNAAIKLIKLHGEDGMKRWKEEQMIEKYFIFFYGKRLYIEGFFSRLKQIFGFSLKNKSEINREKELLINAICSINLPRLAWLSLRWQHEFVTIYFSIRRGATKPSHNIDTIQSGIIIKRCKKFVYQAITCFRISSCCSL